MRKELGKWLMDIGKYMVTALLLSSVFADMSSIWVLVFVLTGAVLTLFGGLWLLQDKKEDI